MALNSLLHHFLSLVFTGDTSVNTKSIRKLSSLLFIRACVASENQAVRDSSESNNNNNNNNNDLLINSISTE